MKNTREMYVACARCLTLKHRDKACTRCGSLQNDHTAMRIATEVQKAGGSA